MTRERFGDIWGTREPINISEFYGILKSRGRLDNGLKKLTTCMAIISERASAAEENGVNCILVSQESEAGRRLVFG